jgi:hypothetical protein
MGQDLGSESPFISTPRDRRRATRPFAGDERRGHRLGDQDDAPPATSATPDEAAKLDGAKLV